MMATIHVVRGNSMWFIFKTRKQQNKEREAEAKDKQIEALKAKTQDEAQKATDAVKQLNKLVEEHGISGLIYFSTGKGRKK